MGFHIQLIQGPVVAAVSEVLSKNHGFTSSWSRSFPCRYGATPMQLIQIAFPSRYSGGVWSPWQVTAFQSRWAVLPVVSAVQGLYSFPGNKTYKVIVTRAIHSWREQVIYIQLFCQLVLSCFWSDICEIKAFLNENSDVMISVQVQT